MGATCKVAVKGQPKGEIYKKHGRWCWFIQTRGIEQWPRSATKEDVRSFIARVCLAIPADVTFARGEPDHP